jgi:cytochrome P450
MEFHPERFAREHMAAFHLTAKDLETFAFGSGPRVCIGAYLARAEIREILFQFFKNIDTGTLEGELKMSSTNESLISPVKVSVTAN